MKQKKRPASTEQAPQRLIAAAIEEIEQHGLGQLTVRNVAAAAGVNIAAVNYYFRSKETLVAAALEGSVLHMVEDTDAYIARLPRDPQAVLTELLAFYLEGALRYPRLSRALLHDAFTTDDYRGPFPTLFGPAMQRMRDAVRAVVPGLDDRRAAQRVIAALSAVFFPAFFAGLYAPFAALESEADRQRYAEEIARQVLAPLEDGSPSRAPQTKRR